MKSCYVAGCGREAAGKWFMCREHAKWDVAEGSEPWHGTTGGATNHDCKCLPCRKAWAAYVARRRAERTALLRADPTLAQHGLESTYHNWGCRCEPCSQANREAARLRRQRVARV